MPGPSSKVPPLRSGPGTFFPEGMAEEPDPKTGVWQWSWRRVRHHLKGSIKTDVETSDKLVSGVV